MVIMCGHSRLCRCLFVNVVLVSAAMAVTAPVEKLPPLQLTRLRHKHPLPNGKSTNNSDSMSLLDVQEIDLRDVLAMLVHKTTTADTLLPTAQELPSDAASIQVFESFDADKNGTLSKTEFEAMLKIGTGSAVDKSEAAGLFSQMDADASGQIDLDDLMEQLKKTQTEEASIALDTSKCEVAANQERHRFTDDVAALPQHFEDWCLELSTGAAESDAKGWRGACGVAREEVRQKFDTKTFCVALARGLAGSPAHRWWRMGTAATKYLPYAPPRATPWPKLSYLKHPRPCCRPHDVPGGGCHDEDISECVCKRDPLCCGADGGVWDLKCAEQVELLTFDGDDTVTRCGRCPGQECLAKLHECGGACDCSE